jgi:hypothetical protein
LAIASKNKIKTLDQYHSTLEHTFLWTVVAESAHSTERFMIVVNRTQHKNLKIMFNPLRFMRERNL